MKLAQRIFNGPSALEPRSERVVFHSCVLGPFGNGPSLAAVTHGAAVLFAAWHLTACAPQQQSKPEFIRLPPVETTRLVYPSVPPDALVCLSEPTLPDNVTRDTELAAWAESVRNAGRDCREKLDWIRALVATWPRS